MNMQREDTEPWYRQFWPWFIMALPASAVVAGLYTVWIAMQTTDSLVVQSDDGMNVVTERNTAAEREADPAWPECQSLMSILESGRRHCHGLVSCKCRTAQFPCS